MIFDIWSSYKGEDYSVRYLGWSGLDARIECSFLLTYIVQIICGNNCFHFLCSMHLNSRWNQGQQPMMGNWTWRFGWNAPYQGFFSKSIFSMSNELPILCYTSLTLTYILAIFSISNELQILSVIFTIFSESGGSIWCAICEEIFSASLIPN